MTTFAMRLALPRVRSWTAIEPLCRGVFGRRQRFQVGRVYAESVLAFMVNLMAIGNRAMRQLISKTVSSCVSATDGEYAIVRVGAYSRTEPWPALIRAANIDFLPESLGWVADPRGFVTDPAAVLPRSCVGLKRLAAVLASKLIGHRSSLLRCHAPGRSRAAGAFRFPNYTGETA